LDNVIEKSIKMALAEEKLIKDFAGINLSSSEARDVWPHILDHKWYLSERLGRDVGLRVALIDYFENIQPLRTKPSGLKGWFLRSQEWLLAQAVRPETDLSAFENTKPGTRY
jgi:hypothetical protein